MSLSLCVCLNVHPLPQDWTVKYYIELGAEPDKLVIGIPTYGRSYTLLDGNFTDFGSSANGPGEQGAYTKEKGFMAFYEVRRQTYF